MHLNSTSIIVFCLFFLSCGITESEITDSDLSTFPIQINNEINSSHISAFYSLSSSTKKHEIDIPLNYSHIVIAYNSDNKPLLIAEANESSVVFELKSSAILIASLFGNSLYGSSKALISSQVEQHPEFDEMVLRFSKITNGGISFVDDTVFISKLRKINSDLALNLSEKNRGIPDNILSIGSQNPGSINIKNQSKVPFLLSSSYLPTNNQVDQSGLMGQNLNNDLRKDDPKQIAINDGAYQFTSYLNKNNQSLMVQKAIMDVYHKTINASELYNNPQKSLEFEELLKLELAQTKFSNFSGKKAIVSNSLNVLQNNEKLLSKIIDLNYKESPDKNATKLFLTTMIEVLALHGFDSPVFSDDSFYSQLEELQAHEIDQTLCFYSSIEVACKPHALPLQYELDTKRCGTSGYRITFGSVYFAPFGLKDGSKIRVEWEFSPQGNSGLWLIDPATNPSKVNGKTETTGCFTYGATENLKLTLSVRDHDQRESERVTVEIAKPKQKASESTNSTTNTSAADIRF